MTRSEAAHTTTDDLMPTSFARGVRAQRVARESQTTGATAMRRHCRSGKLRALHFGVTVLLTFSAVAPRGIVRRFRRKRMKLSAVAVALAATLGSVVGAHAQAYPSRPVTIIVPFPARGPSDT